MTVGILDEPDFGQNSCYEDKHMAFENIANKIILDHPTVVVGQFHKTKGLRVIRSLRAAEKIEKAIPRLKNWNFYAMVKI